MSNKNPPRIPPKHEDATHFSTTTSGTSVDLGFDLLEETGILPGAEAPVDELESEASPPIVPLTQDQVLDELESARILQGEGLVEEAKKVLRKVLLADPLSVVARKRLEEIHELELKQILGDSETRRPPERGEKPQLPADSEAVMRSLDNDLKLGVFDPAEGGEGLALELALFGSREAMDAFGSKLDRDLAETSAGDRMDIGIAFLEMGLPDLAACQFNVAARESSQRLAASSLLAQAMLAAGRAYEAGLVIETILNDSDTPAKDKTEFVYLMGRVSESLKKPGDALRWYQHLAETSPYYRDLPERLRKIKKAARAQRGGPG